MPSNAPRNLKLRKILFGSLLGLICIVVVYAIYQQKKVWAVPEEVKKLKNPLPPSESNRKAAMARYQDKCAQCHGDAGKGDGPEAMMHDPSPADLTDARHMNTLTDGEIFYQISEGRKPMPSFKKRLTEDQRWQLVLLVRSFAQPAATPEQKPDGGQKPASSSMN
jgi:mono/diheme cytochrome c family protein